MTTSAVEVVYETVSLMARDSQETIVHTTSLKHVPHLEPANPILPEVG